MPQLLAVAAQLVLLQPYMQLLFLPSPTHLGCRTCLSILMQSVSLQSCRIWRNVNTSVLLVAVGICPGSKNEPAVNVTRGSSAGWVSFQAYRWGEREAARQQITCQTTPSRGGDCVGAGPVMNPVHLHRWDMQVTLLVQGASTR